MNYNDQILENKAFNFFKQLMYNIALSLCIMLVGVLILVYGFKIGLYEVLSNSQSPHFVKGDMVIVKPQQDYEVGDIIKFNIPGSLPTTHRLLGIVEENGQTYYICHGDAVDNLDGSELTKSDWEDDAEFMKTLIGNHTVKEIADGWNVQTPTRNHVEGKVIGHLNNYGTYMTFIKSHVPLIISIFAGIWCISSVVQNEIEFRKSRRLIKW